MSRNISLDLLRIIAMFMILVLHSIVFMDMPSFITINDCLLYDIEIAFCRSGVNVFVLLTGYFLCSEQIKIKKIYTLLSSILFFNFILLLVKQIVSGGVTLSTILMCLSPFKYWFINCYVGLMLLSPFMNIAIKNMPHKSFDILVVVLTIINLLLGRFIGTEEGFSLIWFINLFLIGQRLRRTSIRYSFQKLLILIFISISLNVAGSFLVLNHMGNVDSYKVGVLGVYSNVFCLMTSVCLFLLFKQTNLAYCNKKVSALAISAFSVYLISENFIVKSDIWNIWNSLLHITNCTSYIITFLPIQIIFCSLLFIICVTIDKLRQQVFNVLKVDSLIDRLDVLSVKLLYSVVNRMRKDDTA